MNKTVGTRDVIDPKGLELFLQNNIVVTPDKKNPFAIILRSHTFETKEITKNLRAIGRAGTGMNNLPMEQLNSDHIFTFNAAGANADSVAELVIMSTLATARHALRAAYDLRNAATLKNEKLFTTIEKSKSKYKGDEVCGKNLGLIGLGDIAAKVADIAIKLGMKVYGFDPFLSVEKALAVPREVIRVNTLDQLLSNCYCISIHTPLTPDTENLINASLISKMQKGVRIINCARGEIVNNSDMLTALNSGQISCYVTDFPSIDLSIHENVISFPHLGASTDEAEIKASIRVCEKVNEFIMTGNVVGAYNFPNTTLPTEQNCMRLGVTHPNTSGQLRGILDVVNESNIKSSTQNSKGEFAYAILNVEKEKFNQTIIDKLNNISKTQAWII